MYATPAARAQCAAKAANVRPSVEEYRDRIDPREPIGTVLVDLLADLIHYAASVGEDWDSIAEQAAAHVEAERAGE